MNEGISASKTILNSCAIDTSRNKHYSEQIFWDGREQKYI